MSRKGSKMKVSWVREKHFEGVDCEFAQLVEFDGSVLEGRELEGGEGVVGLELLEGEFRRGDEGPVLVQGQRDS